MGNESSESSVERIAKVATERGWKVAAAESLTSGQIAASLGAGPDASTWFCGSVVAYSERVKFDVLGVDEGPVITETCARQMVNGVATLLGADATVAATGVGGPGPTEGQPPGTVYQAVAVNGRVTSRGLDLPGGPEEVLNACVEHALVFLADLIEEEDPA